MTIDDRLRRVEERTVRIEEQLSSFAKDHRAILVTLQGPPRADSIRGRLHKLEDDRAAASAAESALAAARLINEQSRERNERSRDRRFSRREKVAGLAAAIALALPAYIDLISHFH